MCIFISAQTILIIFIRLFIGFNYHTRKLSADFAILFVYLRGGLPISQTNVEILHYSARDGAYKLLSKLRSSAVIFAKRCKSRFS